MGSIGIAELLVIAAIGAMLLVPAVLAIVYITKNGKKPPTSS